MTDREYVESRWEVGASVRVNDYREIVLRSDRDYEAWEWSAAAEFTRQREQKIAWVEEEIAILTSKILLEDRDIKTMDRIVAVEQDRLKALRVGFREVK